MSYLSNRTQCTKYYGAVSDALQITSGVPQGSILGPILFNVYLNRLLKLLPDECAVAYADDLTLVCSDDALQTAHQRMQSLLDLISTWAKNNQLCINVSKCYTMSIAASARKSTTCLASKLYLSNHQISTVSDIKVLGVSFTRDLKWQLHQSSVRRKLSNMMSVVARFGRSLNIKARKNIVLPHLTHCLPVWGVLVLAVCPQWTASLSALPMLFCTIRMQLWIVLQLWRLVCVLLKQHCFIEMSAACFLLWRTVLYLPILTLTCYLQILLLILDRSSVCNKLKYFKHALTRDEYCFQYAGTHDWNLLPNNITALNNFANFKSQVYTNCNGYV